MNAGKLAPNAAPGPARIATTVPIHGAPFLIGHPLLFKALVNRLFRVCPLGTRAIAIENYND